MIFMFVVAHVCVLVILIETLLWIYDILGFDSSLMLSIMPELSKTTFRNEIKNHLRTRGRSF